MAEGWDEGGLRALRGVLKGSDGTTLLAALRRRPVSEVLQLAGDVVAGAAALGLPGAAQMAARSLEHCGSAVSGAMRNWRTCCACP